ncbi:MAG TPA: hypothetical protein VHI93_01170 [Candidatus Thermoplasmatota archaeon]|nr:hypothetical protein [Candidatus Thermoplasmatota archaeon]
MRFPSTVALLFLTLAGCLEGGADRYFPPASELPDGLAPYASDGPDWQMVAPLLGLSSNPGRVGALDRLPGHDLGQVAAAHAYLLKGSSPGQSYGIFVLEFRSGADIGAHLAEGEAHACDGHEVGHVLRDGNVYVLVGGDGSTAHGRQVLARLADAVKARSGATLVC